LGTPTIPLERGGMMEPFEALAYVSGCVFRLP